MLTKYAMSEQEFAGLPTMVGVVTAGRALGLGRKKTYALVKQGSFPVQVLTDTGRYKVRKIDLILYLQGHIGAPPPVTSGDDARIGW